MPFDATIPDQPVARPVCNHCQDPARVVNRPRGLCWGCYYSPGVRDLYPSTSKYAHRGVGHGSGGLGLPDEPTAAAPRSPEKVAVLAERAKSKQALWHPLDADVPADLRTHGPGESPTLPTLYARLERDVMTTWDQLPETTLRNPAPPPSRDGAAADSVHDWTDLPEVEGTAGVGQPANALRLCDCAGCGVDVVGEATARVTPPRYWGKDRDGRRRRAVAGRALDPKTGSRRPYCPSCLAEESRRAGAEASR